MRIFLFLLFFIPLALSAQEKPCKPLLKANRGKVLTMSEVSVAGYSFSIGEQRYVVSGPGASQRNVRVTQNEVTLAEFKISGFEISDAVYGEYRPDGTLRTTDSLDPKRGRHLKMYMGYFQSSHVVSSTSYYPKGNPARREDYSLRNGKDSAIRTWYSNSFPKSLHVKNYWQYDSIIVKWDSTGILRENMNSKGTMLYYANGVLMRNILPYSQWHYSSEGILEEVSCDTLLSGKPCQEKKTFYPNGILKSKEYYSNGEPCHTWSFYTPEGILKQNVKKGIATTLEIGVGMVEQEYAPEIFTYVEEMPEYPGGYSMFRKDTELRLAELLCKSEVELEGTYRFQFTVSEEGKASFKSLEGLNAQKLGGLFTALFSNMPKWRPRRQNGRTMAVVLAVDITVKEK